MNKAKTPLEELKSNLFVTKSARFNADERLRFEHRLANYTLMILSVYIVALSIGSAYKVHFLIIEQSEFWSALLSVALLGVAALEAGNSREVRAFRLHENALKIGGLYRRVRSLNPDNFKKEELDAYSDEYEKLLLECEYNHFKIDEVRLDWSNTWRHLWKQRIPSFLYWILLWIRNFGIYYLAIFLPPIILLIYNRTQP